MPEIHTNAGVTVLIITLTYTVSYKTKLGSKYNRDNRIMPAIDNKEKVIKPDLLSYINRFQYHII